MAAVPYDPPPTSRSPSNAPRQRSASHSKPRRASVSLFDRVRSGLVATEHLADEAEEVAGQVGKAARTARRIEDDIEAAYGSSGRGARPIKGTRGSGYETSELETDAVTQPALSREPETNIDPPPDVVPYQSAGSTTRQRKQKTLAAKTDSLDDFLADVEAAQEAVDNCSDDVELIASERHRLTGLPYSLHKLLKRRARDPPRSRSVEVDEAIKLAALLASAKTDLLRAYKDVCALGPRAKALLSSSSSGSKAFKRAKRDYDTVTASYASLLDFVEDRAKEEKCAREDGTAEDSLMDRMRDDHPEWDRAKLVAQLQSAKKAAQTTSLVKIDYARDPYTGRWLLQQPFTELDDVLQAIDLAENGITKRQDEKTGSWALRSLLSRAFSPPRKPRKSSSRKSKASKRSRQLNEREIGKSDSFHLQGKPSHRSHASDVSTDTDDWSAAEKQQAGLLPSSNTAPGEKGSDSDDSYDASQLPERVPTDDTSGYVESQADMIADAKDQRRTEHFYTPLLAVYWICIAILYLYYLIARLLGFQSPLGDVDLGSHFGNSAWSDTHDGLVVTRAATTSASTTSSLFTPEVLTGVPSVTNLDEVLKTASSFDAALASGPASSVVGAVTAMATVTAAP